MDPGKEAVPINLTHERCEAARNLYASLNTPAVSVTEARRLVHELSMILAESTERALDQAGIRLSRTIFCFILRGAFLMLPAFVERFREAHFALVTMRRVNRKRKGCVVCEPKISAPDAIVLVDCIAASGQTLMNCLARLRGSNAPFRLACLVSCTSAAAQYLSSQGIALIAVSGSEKEMNGLVVPDLGARDAGDVALNGTVS